MQATYFTSRNLSSFDDYFVLERYEDRMSNIPVKLIRRAQKLLSTLPGRVLCGINYSDPEEFLHALSDAGISQFGVTTIGQARRVRQFTPDASLVLTVSKISSGMLAEAYTKLGIRAFRIRDRHQLELLISSVDNAKDLTIIVHLPALGEVSGSSWPNANELKALLFQARRDADLLGLGYQVRRRFVRGYEHITALGELREAIKTAGVTVDVIDIVGSGPFPLDTRHPESVSGFFKTINKAFDSLPISYSAELWLQPSRTFVRDELFEGWRDDSHADLVHEPKSQTYFISYASEQEPLAQEVLSVVEGQGHQAIVQFRDFAQGRFVRSMREGIERADRFIALQSKAYWKSDHCQAEWDAAYARDPGGQKRLIIPFLIEPIPLPPIASELVYKSLIGLNADQRQAAIADWINYRPHLRSRTQLRRALAKQASPDVRIREQRLDAGPNATFDRPFVDEDLAELPANLRALIDTLLDALPRNTPPIVRSCLGGYRQHLLERGTQPVLGTIVPFAEALGAQNRADTGQWDVGLETLFDHFLRRHQLMIAHFPLNPERELLFRETAIDEIRASGALITEPVTRVGEAVAQLRSAGLTTEEFDSAQRAHQEFGRDMASLPMPSHTDETSITPKRRYILGTIGFYERMLAALGGVASIGGIAMVPQVQAAVAAATTALQAAIEMLLQLLV